jgi:hypothetical protein
MVPAADFTSYYGLPVLNPPVWAAPDIPGYLFLGGLAGSSSLLGAAASATGRHRLATVCKTGAAGGVLLSLAALVHDLGRPSRFLNMLRVFKVTSPMSVGSWLLSAYTPMAVVSASSALTGRWRPLGTAATVGSVALAPVVTTYTGALLSDTAVPAWHDGYREMPFVFAGSGAMAAGGLGLVGAPRDERGLARAVAVTGTALELAASHRMTHRMGFVAEPYERGRAGLLMRAGQVTAVASAVGALLARGPRASRVAGTGLVLSSALTRFGIFAAGMASARDPRYTVQPQRDRLADRDDAAGDVGG